MEPRYELFDHTADMGIRVYAPTMAGLVQPAAAGLYAVIGNLAPGSAVRELAWDLTADDPAVLLRDYLAELLVLFERERRIVTSPDVREFADKRLTVHASTALVDEDRSCYHHEVKAVTYHELAIAPVPGGYQATIIVDI